MAQQKVHYAVLQFDEGWASSGENYVFPLTAVNASADKDELVLDVDRSKIETMKSFPDERYSQLSERVGVADADRYLVTVVPAGGQASTAASAHSGARHSAAAGSTDTAAAEMFERVDK